MKHIVRAVVSVNFMQCVEQTVDMCKDILCWIRLIGMSKDSSASKLGVQKCK